MRLFLALSVLFAMALVSRPAEACMPAWMEEHTLDPDEAAVDSTAPGQVEVVAVTVNRTSQLEGCVRMMCFLSNVVVEFVPPEDDRTPTEQMGYRFEILSQEGVPRSLLSKFDDVTIRAFGEGRLFFDFTESGQRNPFRMEIAVRAVDLAGNEGPPTTFVVRDPPEGCGSSTAGGGWPLLPLLSAWLMRQHRARRT